jgi:hypothetical protein
MIRSDLRIAFRSLRLAGYIGLSWLCKVRILRTSPAWSLLP